MFASFYFVTLICSQGMALFFGGSSGGCGGGCRPQCNCAVQRQPVCPPTPCYQSYRAPIPVQQQYNQYQQPSYQQFQNYQQFQAVPRDQQGSLYIQPQTYNQIPLNSYSPPDNSVKIVSENPSQSTKLIEKVETEVKATSLESEDDAVLESFENSLKNYKSTTNNGGVRRAEGLKNVKEDETKCSSSTLRKIIKSSMSSNVSASKIKIAQRAKKEFGFNFDVICSDFDFSYLISSTIYCRVERNGHFCLAFEH